MAEFWLSAININNTDCFKLTHTFQARQLANNNVAYTEENKNENTRRQPNQ